MKKYTLLLLPLFWGWGDILIPMDLSQKDHLRAYGIAYEALKKGHTIEWLLNYRGGSFLIPEDQNLIDLMQIRGVTYEILKPQEILQIHEIIENNNMNRIILEKAPKIAVYAPPYANYAEPWDDAVVLALNYAMIPYEHIYDEEVLRGDVFKYDWVHLHHEDFTAQYGKFYLTYKNTPWYQAQVNFNESLAKKLNFKKVSQMKKEVAKVIRSFVEKGGFLFAMCSAPITLDIALSSEKVDILHEVFDGDPPDPNFQEKLDYSKTLAFKDFRLISDPNIYEHSDIDVSQEASLRGPDTYFYLFDFSAKFDPIPTILTQNHTKVIREFLGQDTGFKKDKLKSHVIILGEVYGTNEAKYIYGNFGEGFFSYLGGHDPEDYQHFIYDPPTDLRLYKNSPGYRLILNNIFLPAYQKSQLKT